MSKQEEILNIVRLKGPVLPVHIAREVRISMLFAGAYLAELVSNKKIIISKLKVGSSPLYYHQGQETKLQNYIKHLNNQERSAFENLKHNKILNDKELEPIIRVALRNIKDFAISVKVNLKTGTELYWKWYLIPNNEAETMIRNHINQKIEKETNQQQEKTNENLEQEKPKQQKYENEKQIKQEIKKTEQEEIKKEELQQKKLEKDKIKQQEPEKEKKKKIEQNKTEELKIIPPEVKITKSKPKKTKKRITKQKTKKNIVQKELIETKLQEDTPQIKNQLFNEAKEFFKKKNIKVINCETIIQNKEMDLQITISTAIGDLPYFCKVKKKVRSTENDLFETVLAAQKKGLPSLYISTGTINKKAKEILNTKSQNIQFLSLKE